MRGFALTASYDLDLATLCEDSPRILASALALTFRTWRSEWIGNLRLGVDPGLLGLKAPEDEIRLTLVSESQALTRAWDGLTVNATDAYRDHARTWRVHIDALAGGEPITYDGILAL